MSGPRKSNKNPEEDIVKNQTSKKVRQPTWTVIVYMAGDNELSEDMATALQAMKGFANDPDIRLVALYDSVFPPVPVTFYDFTRLPPTNPLEPCCRTSEHHLRCFARPEALREILDEPEPIPTRDAPEPYEFDKNKEFVPIIKYVPWVLKQTEYWSDRYALILSGHSDGVIGRTIMRDDNPPNVLDLPSLARVLERCRLFLPTRTHPDRKFDLIGFDGCLMGMLEAAYEMKDIAKYMVASEGNIPFSGWNYAMGLAAFKPDPTSATNVTPHCPNPREAASKLVRHYAEYNRDYAVSGRAINISAFQLSEAESFAKKINEIAGELLDLLKFDKGDEDAAEKAVFRDNLIKFILRSHYWSQTFMHNQAVDIMDFLFNLLDNWLLLIGQLNVFVKRHLGAKGEVRSVSFFPVAFDLIQTLYGDLTDQYDAFVTESCFVGAEYQFSVGVSLFFPWGQMPLNLLSSQYRALRFDKDMENWRCFCKKVVELTMRTPETRSFAKVIKDNKRTENASDKNGTNIIDFETQKDSLGKEYVGKEYVGREYVGRGDEFYGYFEQMKNFSYVKRECGYYGVDFYCCNDPESLE